MEMISNINGYLIGALAALFAIIVVYFKGRSSGKSDQVKLQKQEDATQAIKQWEVIATVEKQIKSDKEARNAQADSDITDSLIADSVRNPDKRP